MKRLPFILPALFGVALVAPSFAADLRVGPGKSFARIEDALTNARSGDTILIYPSAAGKAYSRTAVYVAKDHITFKGIPAAKGGRVAIDGTDYDYSGEGRIPRAIFQFNRGADGCVLEGMELSGAHNESHNGAGVRINQANDVVIRECNIHDNDMGIMSNGDGTDQTGVNQLIESCLIHSNGSLKEPGFNHNLYLGGTSVRLIACEVHSSLTGHNVKSRAHRTEVLYCFIHDSANREFDLVDAQGDTTAPNSDAFLVGNIIVKAKNGEGNHSVIQFGADVGHEHDGTVYVDHNTIVTPYISPVVALSAPKAKVCFTRNIVWDAGSGQKGQKIVDLGKMKDPNAVSGHCNWLSPGFSPPPAGLMKTILARHGQSPSFVNADKGDFHLVKPDMALVDAGKLMEAKLLKVVGLKLFQYKPPQGKEDRPASGKSDLGACGHIEQF